LYIQYQQEILEKIKEKVESLNIKFNWLGFADDLVIEADNPDEYNKIISIFKELMEESGLILN